MLILHGNYSNGRTNIYIRHYTSLTIKKSSLYQSFSVERLVLHSQADFSYLSNM